MPAAPHPRIYESPRFAGHCTCGRPHPEIATTLYTAPDTCRAMAADCAAHGGRVLLLSDPQTDAVAGKELREELQRQGVELEHCLLPAEPETTEDLVAQIRQAAQGTHLILGVGAGTINDLGKLAAAGSACEFWCMPTAPSMNGYTSSIAAVKVKGVKRTLPAPPPGRLYVDPQVIRQAPLKMRLAGYCDVQAKQVSDIDWQCESLLFEGSYCGLPAALMRDAEKSYLDRPEAIGRGEEDAVRGLFDGLLLSGVAMSLAGSSAPASGGEHLVSHFWDMREPLTGRKPELHGLQVGLGILLSAACYARLARLRPKDLAAVADERYGETAAAVPQIWGELTPEVLAQFQRKEQRLRRFDTLLPQHWPQLQGLFAQVAPAAEFAARFARTGSPFSLDALALSVEEFRLAVRHARAIRERITVLDLAAHAGVLEAASEDTLALLG